MQGRAVAVYGLVLALVAAGAFAYASTAETPEPSLDDPEHTLEVGETFTVDDRTYNLTGFGTQQGSPTAKLQWVDEDARSLEEWTHAEEPGGTTVVHDGTEYWVRIPQTPGNDSFTLLETPGENASYSVFTDDDGNWLVNDGGEYVNLEDFEELERLEVELDAEIDVGEEDDVRTVRVDDITNESVTVSWNDPVATDIIVPQADRSELNGAVYTVHVPGDGTAEFTSDEDDIEAYLGDHEDSNKFDTRMDGLLMTSTIAVVGIVLLLGLAFLPRKE